MKTYFYIVSDFMSEGPIVRIDELDESKRPTNCTAYSGPLATRQEALGLLHKEPCSMCGGYIDNGYINATELASNKLCWHCNHWSNMHVGPNDLVIDGGLYHVSPDNNQSFFKGLNGSRHIIKKDSGEIVITHNLWHKGNVPTRFKDKFPNNATFLI